MRKLKDSALALIRNRTEQPLVSVFDTTLVQKLSKIKGREKREIIVSHLKKEKEKEEGDKLKESKKDTVDDSTIFKHLDELSKGQMKVDDSVKLNHTAEILAMNREKMLRENAARNKNRSNNNKNKRRKK